MYCGSVQSQGLSYYIQAFEMLSSVMRSVYGVASKFLISTGVNFFFVDIRHLHLVMSSLLLFVIINFG